MDKPAKLKCDKVSAMKLKRLITTKAPISGVMNPMIRPVINAYRKKEYSNKAKMKDSLAAKIMKVHLPFPFP